MCRYICQALHARIPDQLRHHFIDPLSLVLSTGTSLLLVPYGAGGSAQDLINKYLQQGQASEVFCL